MNASVILRLMGWMFISAFLDIHNWKEIAAYVAGAACLIIGFDLEKRS